MSDEAAPKSADVPTSAEVDAAVPTATPASGAPEEEETNGTKAGETKDVVMGDAQTEAPASEQISDEQPSDQGLPTNDTALVESSETPKDTALDSSVITPADDAIPETENSFTKAKASSRRKSGGVPEHKRKLNKKASRANLTHTDAKPGDHFFARLKGFPPWPVIICDEVMLPTELIKSRPAGAEREDGTYREGYEDGGLKVKDRQFAIMYLHTNEFGWIKNTDLQDLDFETVGIVPGKMRKDLQEAHRLAAEQNDLDYYKEVLKNFIEQREAHRLAKQEAKAAKAAAKVKKEKPKPQKNVADEDEDVEMPEADGDSDDTASIPKKRKAEDDAVPGDSNKKLKLAIKFKAPQTPNGTSTPKAAKDSSSTKSSKPKTKKATPKVDATPEAVAPKEPELTTEEKRAKKEKEILFLRHKLQKGLLTKDQPPKEDEMKQMSEFISKLEGYSELEVSIIRATKINKVLKAIIKLSSIPKEEEFQFKTRSQTLLDKWNKLLAGEQSTPVAPAAPAATNGTSDAKTALEMTKKSPIEDTAGAQESSANAEEKTEEKTDTDPSASEIKETIAAPEKPLDPAPGEPAEKVAPEAIVEESAA